jgi:hypothetical protein
VFGRPLVSLDDPLRAGAAATASPRPAKRTGCGGIVGGSSSWPGAGAVASSARLLSPTRLFFQLSKYPPGPEGYCCCGVLGSEGRRDLLNVRPGLSSALSRPSLAVFRLFR